MAKNNALKITIASLGLASVASIGIVAAAQSATTNNDLTISSTAALTLYAGDDTVNNDRCTPGDDGAGVDAYSDVDGSAASVTCAEAERTVTLAKGDTGTTFATLSVRDVATGTISDLVWEDASGSNDYTYNMYCTAGDLIAQSTGRNIALGGNLDGETEGSAADTETDAPSATNGGSVNGGDISADNGKQYAVVDPSGADIDGMIPTGARDAANELILNNGIGSSVTVVDTSTQVTIFAAAGDVLPGVYDADGVAVKWRLPAFPDADDYVADVACTIVAA